MNISQQERHDLDLALKTLRMAVRYLIETMPLPDGEPETAETAVLLGSNEFLIKLTITPTEPAI